MPKRQELMRVAVFDGVTGNGLGGWGVGGGGMTLEPASIVKPNCCQA